MPLCDCMNTISVHVLTCTTAKSYACDTTYFCFGSYELSPPRMRREKWGARWNYRLKLFFSNTFSSTFCHLTEQKVGMFCVELSDVHKNLNSIFTTCKPYYFPWGTQNVMNFDTLRSGIKLVRICKIFILFLRCEVVAIEFGFLLSRCIISILYHYHYLSLCTINAWIWCIRLLFRL